MLPFPGTGHTSLQEARFGGHLVSLRVCLVLHGTVAHVRD